MTDNIKVGKSSICPRCGTQFTCSRDAIAVCHCSTIELDDKVRQLIAARYHACLCGACLAELARGKAL